MRLITYRTLQTSQPSVGLIVADGKIINVGRALGCPALTLRQLLEQAALPTIAALAVSEGFDETLDEVELLPVIPDPSKIFCVGLNYSDHAIETKLPIGLHPVLFLRVADSQVGHGQPLVKPLASDAFDFEGELAVIIGKSGRHIPASDALSHVAGYACYNDVSVRDWQLHTSQFTPGKNFAGTGAFGPWLVTADEIGDPSHLNVTTRLNGIVVQDAPTNLMVFSVQKLIEYTSTFIDLKPGDVIVSGTPAGVGMSRTPPLYMKPGDIVEVDIPTVGVLRNEVQLEKKNPTHSF